MTAAALYCHFFSVVIWYLHTSLPGCEGQGIVIGSVCLSACTRKLKTIYRTWATHKVGSNHDPSPERWSGFELLVQNFFLFIFFFFWGGGGGGGYLNA